MMNNEKNSLTINPKHWIRIATAARLRGVKRQAIYYRVRAGHVSRIVIDKSHFVFLPDIESLKFRAGGAR